MSKNKTSFTEVSVEEYLSHLHDNQKLQDSRALIELMEAATHEPAQMFGHSIIGFGKYEYKYDSGHEGEAPLIGFSPRKTAISLYVYSGTPEQDNLLLQLGKFKKGKSCIYIKKLSDINTDMLLQLIDITIHFISNKYNRINI